MKGENVADIEATAVATATMRSNINNADAL